MLFPLCFMYVVVFHSPQAAWLCISLGPIRKQKPHHNFKQGKLDIKNIKPRSESNCKEVKKTLKSTLSKDETGGRVPPRLGLRHHGRMSSHMRGSLLEGADIGWLAAQKLSTVAE